MNWKRALWMGALLYIASFASGILLAVIYGVDLSSAPEPTTAMWITGTSIALLLTVLFARWYFTKETPSMKEGALLGLMFIGVGALFDMLIIVPYILTTDAPQDPLAYYSSPMFWVTMVGIVLAATVVGKLQEK